MVKFVKPSVEILTRIDTEDYLRQIERAARTCYKSEFLMDDNSHHKLIKYLVEKGHWAMIEHAPRISVKFIADRGMSHEMVRHRLASFAQESTCYVNCYKKEEIEVIEPAWFEEKGTMGMRAVLIQSYEECENSYNFLVENGVPVEIARSVLPIGLKTEIIVTANLREWHHIFTMRTTEFAHPTIRALMRELLADLKNQIPYIFSDL